MKTMKKLVIAILVLIVMVFLVGCSETVVPDGATGVVVHDGIVSDEYLQPGRHTTDDSTHTSIVIVDNKIKTASYSNTIEGQSKDDVIINASGYSFSYRIGGGAKSVWLVKNISDRDNIVPPSIVENALKDALLEVEAKNVTKRVFVEPIFKEILQKRINEYLGYHNGEDTTLITVTSVSIGNLSLEAAYDQELSRGAILTKRAENDKLEYETSIASAETQAELAKYEAERLTAGWEELSEKFTPEVAAYLIIEKWDGHCTPGSPMEQLIEYYVSEALKDEP
ncbi:hypothetical protein IJI89_04035 [Candidatus Saccharibacteria bacterium]|nr:hypothetical protein [Candidatus Saccharibacteria bacterium]